MARTTFVIKDELDQKVRELAEERDRSRSYIVNEAIGFYFEHRNDFNGKRPQPAKKAGTR